MKSETNEAVLHRLGLILQDSNDAITVQDLNGNILAWNRGAELMYGFTEAEALQMNLSQIVPEDKQKSLLGYLQKIVSGETVKPFETTQRINKLKKHGKILDVWLVITCVTDDSVPIDSVASAEHDITILKNRLRKKEKEVKALRGLLPICANCKEIKDDKGNWHQIESYIRNHSEVEFSHGICPKCAATLYPDFMPDKTK